MTSMEQLDLSNNLSKNKNINIDEQIMSKIEHEYDFLSNDFKLFALNIKKQIYFNVNNSTITFIDTEIIPKMLAYFKTSDYIEFNKLIQEQNEIVNAYLLVNDIIGNNINEFSLITFSILLVLIGDLEEDLKIVKVDKEESYIIIKNDENGEVKAMHLTTNIPYH